MQSGKHASNFTEEIQCWRNWIKERFKVTEEETKPLIAHITEEQWNQQEEGKEKEEIDKDIEEIRINSKLQKLLLREPHIQTWLTQDYDKIKGH